MSDLHRVVILAGGLTGERDVSLKSGRRVADALKAVGVEATLRDADGDLLSALRLEPPDAIFIALHGGPGENGAVRGVLDAAGVPYVGTDAAACRIAFDKPTAKSLVRAAGISTPDWVTLPATTFRELGAAAVLERIVSRLGLPLMVKPNAGGSALGATAVFDSAALPEAMMTCFGYGGTALIERFVTGTEVAISVVDTGGGPVALPAVEITAAGGVYDYAARYTAGETSYATPARLSSAVAAEATRVAVLAHSALGLRDLSRTDLIVDASGIPWFLEVNVAPGMTETSLLPLAVTAADRDLGVLCRDLLAQAAARRP